GSPEGPCVWYGPRGPDRVDRIYNLGLRKEEAGPRGSGDQLRFDPSHPVWSNANSSSVFAQPALGAALRAVCSHTQTAVMMMAESAFVM
ncbi:unnamed protein product, partial [Gadus morhua 'NCC']